jgi:hypothetical protein
MAEKKSARLAIFCRNRLQLTGHEANRRSSSADSIVIPPAAAIERNLNTYGEFALQGNARAKTPPRVGQPEGHCLLRLYLRQY